MMRKFLFLLLLAAPAYSQQLIGALCLNPSGAWIPIATAIGGQSLGSPQQYGMLGINGGTWYGLKCDANGNLTPGSNGFYTLSASMVPVIVAPNGTIATNGVVTLGTALPQTFPNAWLRFPASAVVGGSAGVYFATCTNTTTCQVYTNFVDPSTTAFRPTIPASPVAAVGSNASYTQTTGSALALINTSLAAGAMGPNGIVRKSVWVFVPNNSNAKIVSSGFQGGSGAALPTLSLTTVLNARFTIDFANMGEAAHQESWPALAGSFASSGTAVAAPGTVNTANAQSLIVACNLATATDYCGIMQSLDQLQYGP